MGTKTKVPGISAEERMLQQSQAELLNLQTSILKQQQQQQKVLLPFLAEQEGFDVQLDDNGNITSINKRADPLEDQNKEIQTLLNEKSLKALKGELPVDPALEEGIASQEQTLRERLAGQFGPGYETSSPGIETLGNFFKSSEILREGARTGQLTLAEQLGITRQQQSGFDQASSQDALRMSAVGDPLTFAGAFGQIAKGYGAAQQPYQNQRNMQAQVQGANASRTTSLIGAGIGAIGAYFSDAAMKKDLVPITKTKHGFPVYLYTRTDTGERMIGVLAEDVERVLPNSVQVKDGYDVVRYGDLV